MHIGNVVVAWTTAVQDQLRAGMRAIGLEPRDLAALTLVRAYDGCSPDWLRARVGLTQSGTVRLVDRLAGRQLLTRGASTGRGVPLHVTEAGIDILEQWAQRRDRVIGDLLAGDQDALVTAMASALRSQPR